MAMTLQVASSVIAALLAEAERAAPNEACGLLLGLDRIEAIRPTVNIAADPRRQFEIDPAALIAAHKAQRAGGGRLAGYYHSHPGGPPEPSATDVAHASGDERVWAIIGEGRVRFWRDAPGGFEPLSYAVAKG